MGLIDSEGDQQFPGSPNNPPTHPRPLPEQQSPQYAPPQQQQQRLRSGEGVSCGVAAVLLILMVSVVGGAIFIGVQKAKDVVQSNISALAATENVTQFCQYYESQDYGSIYQMLSKAAQGRASQTRFVSHQTAVDASAGDVMTCTMDPNHPLPSISSDRKTATAWLQVVRGENANRITGKIVLVYEDGAYKIDSADSSLKLY
ncbi:MAG TPA: hypothetical protein VFS83_18460 [Ktedonobacterales bacterium]|nr:hypothetical protein [Ktedonobacterales bacterium]